MHGLAIVAGYMPSSRPAPERDLLRNALVGVWATMAQTLDLPRLARQHNLPFAGLLEAGATGLEPATSGVTGLVERNDDWRR